MNNLNFTGNLGRDAEKKFLPNGDAIVSFSAALTSGYGDKAITTWLNCSGFGKRYEAVSQYLLKGTKVAISGEFQARPYTTKEGIEKLSLEVRINDLTILGSKGDSNTPSKQDNQPQSVKKPDMSIPMEDIDSDLPF